MSGLYVHIPFCRSRCRYCAFTSGAYDRVLADAYISALHSEFAARGVFVPETAFIGGGTPSVLSSRQLDCLLSGLPRPVGEFTCELNPESASPEKLRILRDHGVNRLSFGVQTFSPEGLRILGRVHDAPAAVRAIESAAALGFSNISLDLINCWPGQDGKSLENDLKIAVGLPIRHVSSYTMILEPESGGFAELSGLMSRVENVDDWEKRSWDLIEEFLDSKNFSHYETSNYALSDYECRHNVATWKGREYLGLGVAAHSHVHGRRFANTDDVEKYIKCSSYPERIEVFTETLSSLEKARECGLFWLRLFEGIDRPDFAERTGFTLERAFGPVLSRLTARGLLERDRSGWFLRVPKKYQPVLDSILLELI